MVGWPRVVPNSRNFRELSRSPSAISSMPRILPPAVLLLAMLASAQTFEVASVKPSTPLSNGRVRIAFSGGPGTTDPGRIDYYGITLKTAITVAYKVKDHQVDGPAWTDSERYDIVAT